MAMLDLWRLFGFPALCEARPSVGMRRLFCCGIVGAVHCSIVVGFARVGA